MFRYDHIQPQKLEGRLFDGREFFVGYTPALGIGSVIDSALDEETGFGSRGADQVDDDLMGEPRLATPVLGDERD